eukprot:COSAG01_NODE_10978_length_2035_cov_1.490702_3_plen_148_part_00
MGCTQVSALDVAIDGADSVDLSMVRRHVITHSRTQICASQLRRAQLGFCCAPSPGCLDAHTHTHCLAFVFHPAFGGVGQLGGLACRSDHGPALDRGHHPVQNLVKGGGGALLREKMVEACAKTFVVIVDESKRASRPPTSPASLSTF